MDKIQLLQARKAKIVEVGKEIREHINAVVDKESFVELSAFSFSKNEFYGENAEGEGVVTGFATVDGYPSFAALIGSAFSSAYFASKTALSAFASARPILFIIVATTSAF